MKIISVDVTKGKNHWSDMYSNLIVVKLDLEESDDYPTNAVDGFTDRLLDLLPEIGYHILSGYKSFDTVMREGVNLSVVFRYIVVELWRRTGYSCPMHFVEDVSKGVYHVIYSYEVENAGRYVAEIALRILRAIESNLYCDISIDIAELVFLIRKEGLAANACATAKTVRNESYHKLFIT